TRLEEVREDRSAVRAPSGSGHAARRRQPGETRAGVGAAGQLRAAREGHGRCRPGAAGVKVLVTGANGFVGRTDRKSVVAEGDTVIAAVGPGAPDRKSVV